MGDLLGETALQNTLMSCMTHACIQFVHPYTYPTCWNIEQASLQQQLDDIRKEYKIDAPKDESKNKMPERNVPAKKEVVAEEAHKGKEDVSAKLSEDTCKGEKVAEKGAEWNVSPHGIDVDVHACTWQYCVGGLQRSRAWECVRTKADRLTLYLRL